MMEALSSYGPGRPADPYGLDELARPGGRTSAAGIAGTNAAGRCGAVGPGRRGLLDAANHVEIDVVGADREPVAKTLLFLGSIKWLERAPFDDHDLVALQRHRGALTDDLVPLLAISRSGVATVGLDAAYGPAELIGAWLHRA